MDNKFLENFSSVIGTDEVGRGPIAGPVNACAVSIAREDLKVIALLKGLGVTDSKKLTSKKRLEILKQLAINIESLTLNQIYKIEIEKYGFSFVLAEKSPSQIDQLNILQASLACMQVCSDALVKKNSIVLVDGNRVFNSKAQEIIPVIKGDSKSVVIGLASIIAKEYRDSHMQKWDSQYPGYDLAKNAGYPTAKHKEAIKKLGITPIHRKTFSGVKEYV